MAQSRVSAAAEAALIAGKELLALYKEGNSGGEMKPDHTLVTKADHHADKLLQDLIREQFPGEGILSEENSTVYPATEHTWVIDPLDGTVNFSQGLHYWGISIAHLVNGQPQDGAVFLPLLDELYTASRGEGAFFNGKPLSIQEETAEELFPLFVHCSRMYKRYAVKTPYKNRSLGAAAYHLCLVAKNTAAVALESTPKIWDFAAGWLIVREAGGAIQSLGDEQPFPAQPGMDYAKKSYPILAARSAALLTEFESGITPLLV
ncbi:MAG TPA: inositol monophosphatase [Chloroflexi bacterium]|nr:MAG: inositol monophosphatase [Chloroflexota bacterium]HDD55985.1 inositol monophosphatase [Chloroflexota bacterium]